MREHASAVARSLRDDPNHENIRYKRILCTDSKKLKNSKQNWKINGENFFYPIPNNSPRRIPWSDLEVAVFEKSLEKYGADFDRLAELLPEKGKVKIQ